MSLFTQRDAKYVWFNRDDYNEDIIVNSVNNTPLINDPESWAVNFLQIVHEWRGVDMEISITNLSGVVLPAPKIRLNTGMYHPTWNGAGSSSYWRHVRNYFNHDTYGMRVKSVSSTTNVSNDRFGVSDAIYNVNWFAPCLAIDNYVDNGYYGNGQQLVSISTNYTMPFNIYGDYDPNDLKAYFNIDMNVNLPDDGRVGDFLPGETRTFSIWLRYETYNHACSFGTAPQRFGSKTYRKIAALRSYEPYFVDYWARNGDHNHGPRISGRIYGVTMSGSDAPTSYFNPKDNPRRYYLFRKSDGKNLMGNLPAVNEFYINPQSVSGWKDFLDYVCNPIELKTFGYKAVMLFNIAGFGNADRGGNPSVFRTLPINLRNTFAELKEWEKTHGIKVIISAENAYNSINTGEYFDRAIPYDDGNGIHQTEIENTFNNGLCKACSGIVFRNLPNISYKTFIKNRLETLRMGTPYLSYFSYGRISNDISNVLSTVYYDRSQFLTRNQSEGGRDWFLDMLTPGADPYVLMSYKSWIADYGDSDTTRNEYDAYAQFIELNHQAVPITVDRLVKSSCLYPNKLNTEDDFLLYASYFILYNNSICRPGDAVINKTVCRPSLVHQYYTTNSPQMRDLIGLYQQDFYVDYLTSPRQSWLPFSGISGDTISGSGEAALWLYQDDKLDKAIQTVVNNLQGIGRGFAYLPADYNGDLFQNFELRAIRQTPNGSVTERQVSVGFGLEMFDTSTANSNANPLVRSVTGLQADAKTLRDWWIWVQNQVNPGWATGLDVAEQSDYLQKEWAARWLYWMKSINSAIRQTIPTVGKIGFFGAIPQSGVWAIKGLFFGQTDPDTTNTRRVTELEYWTDWISEWDYLAPAFYLFKPSVAYNAPFLYINENFVQTPRFEADPVQHRLYHMLSMRDALDVARIANKPLYIFMESSTTGTGIDLPSHISDFLIRSMYTAGCQGSIWWGVIQTRQNAIDLMTKLKLSWFSAGSFIQNRILQHTFIDEAPAPIDLQYFNLPDLILTINPTTYDIPGLDAKLDTSQITTNKIANTGRYLVKSLGGKTQIDKISGFGVSRFNPVISGLVKDKFPEDYANYVILAYANSQDGTFVINRNLSKYNDLQVTIRNPSYSNTGYPHSVIEDTFEWVNSGMPSHLSQVHAVNILTAGYAQEHLSEDTQGLVAPLYQCEIIIPDNTEFYDKLNSSIDYIIEEDADASNLRMSYVNVAFYSETEDLIYVGGANGILLIDIYTKAITKFNFKNFEIEKIVDIKKFRNNLYIADRKKIYVYDLLAKTLRILNIQVNLPNINTIALVNGGVLCIGTNQGIYVGLYDTESFVLTVPTSSPVKKLYAADMIHALTANGDAYFSVNGITWSKHDDKIYANSLVKYFTQTYLATNIGLANDSGSLYSSKPELRYISDEEVINDVAVVGDVLYAAIRDGRYYTYSGELQENTSLLDSIQKLLPVGNQLYLFGDAKFQILSENIVRKLTTGTILR